ncbi:unnamed protein product [Phaeothamnion confervicola]
MRPNWRLLLLTTALSAFPWPTSPIASSTLTCDLALYEAWYDETYSGLGSLTDIEHFWIYTDVTLTNGQAMDRAYTYCYYMMDQLRLDRAGRHGPVEDRFVYDVMCAPACLGSDTLREEAMAMSGCSCAELSVSQSSSTSSFVSQETEGWCLTNTGRILCDVFERCGVWDCRVSDFMCPRHEYNKQEIEFRGLGDCSAATFTAATAPMAAVAALALVGAAVTAWW